MPADGRPDRTDLADALIEHVVDRVVAKLAPLLTDAAPTRYADAKNNPLGSERAFLDAGRRCAFPTFRRARNVVARWQDVERYIESRPARAASEADDDREELKRAGVQLRAGKKP